MTTAQDQQSREAYENGKWYWVEREGWYGEPPTIAPACYKAECDAWYSYIFSGISTPYLKVLGPCELQAARALPAGMEPLCYLRPAAATTPARAWQPRENDGTAQPVYTADQVQAMGRVPPGWQAVPVEPTTEMVEAAAEAHMPFGDMALAIQSAIAAAPQPPAAPATTGAQPPTTGAGSATTGAAQERSPLPARPLRSPECWCECCDTVANSGWRSRMSLCPKCGDKRCPRAYHHDSDCFASPKEPAP